jgi:hypothetical protein
VNQSSCQYDLYIGVFFFEVVRAEPWTPKLRSPLAFVPESVLIPAEIDGTPVCLHKHISDVQRRPGSSTIQ